MYTVRTVPYSIIQFSRGGHALFFPCRTSTIHFFQKSLLAIFNEEEKKSFLAFTLFLINMTDLTFARLTLLFNRELLYRPKIVLYITTNQMRKIYLITKFKNNLIKIIEQF